MNSPNIASSAEQVQAWLTSAFPSKPGAVIENRQPVGSFQQSMERITVTWPSTGETEEVFLRLYRGYLSWWTLITPELPQREQAAWRIANAAGIPVSEVLYTSEAPDVAILRRKPGEAWKMPSDPDAVRDVADLMARLHAAPMQESDQICLPDISLTRLLPRLLAWTDQAGDLSLRREVDDIAQRFAALEERPSGLVHGDWHPGNFLRDKSGTTAVLDWEEAAFGDPRIDVANMYAGLSMKFPDLVRLFLTCYEEQAGFTLGPLQIWLDLTDLRSRIVSAWVKHSLAQNYPLPTANPQVWIE